MIVSSHSHVWRTQRGFTMVELITVLVIIGVLGAIASTRFFDRQTFDAATFADQSRAMLRYGQKVAVAQNRAVFVRLDLNSVALCFDASCSASNRLAAPSGSNSRSAVTAERCGSDTWYCEGVPRGISYALSPSGPTPRIFYFDAQGKPYAATDAQGSPTSTFARLAMAISGDGSSRSVTVEPETGYVH